MKKHFITFLFFVYSILGFSRFSDDFPDRAFTNISILLDDVGNFEVDTVFKLYLNETIANTSYFSVKHRDIYYLDGSIFRGRECGAIQRSDGSK